MINGRPLKSGLLSLHKTESEYVRQIRCPECGHRRGALYSDGHIHCHKCAHHSRGDKETQLPETRTSGPLIEGEPAAIPPRGLTLDTCQRWGYLVGTHMGKPVQIACYRDRDGTLVAQKLRGKDKHFTWVGKGGVELLFGQHLWKSGGKYLVITEGEIDAMSVSQIQDHKWPVVSIPNGAQSAAKTIKANLEWIEQFENVVLMFDNDEPGRKASSECAQLLAPGKARIATLPLKDANDMLVARRGDEIIQAIFNSRAYRPDGILNAKDLWETANNQKSFESVPYPWFCFNTMTHGNRRGEMVLLTAGSGIGKSEVARQIAAHLHNNHGETVGYIALEESVQRTLLGFMGLRLGVSVAKLFEKTDEAARKKAFDEAFSSGRIYLYDHFGSNEIDNLLSKIRYLVVGLGCSTIILDHISIVVSGLDTDDERKAIDTFTTKLRTMVTELNFRLIAIIHLRRDNRNTFEEGGQISLNHIRGSGGPGQLANIVIGLERDQQDPTSRNYTKVRVVKNRHSGETGECGWLVYDPETGLLSDSEGPPKSESEAPPFEATGGTSF